MIPKNPPKSTMNADHIEIIITIPELLDLLRWPVWATQQRRSIFMRSI